ncbi:MAG: LysR family transcriptional regulator [Chlorobi bacterium]|nr:LysR family transcriptional regulator [Chlorobiota bacterium]
MTITQLEYLLALNKHRHFVRASESCFVTQPTLTMQIHKLEEELEVMIFDRSKQPVEPTLVGKEIIQRAGEILLNAKHLKEYVNEVTGKIEGKLRIGIIPTISPYLLPLFLPKFIRENRNIQILLEEIITDEIVTKLKEGILDIGIIATPLNEPGIIEHHLYYETFQLYLSKKHKLRKKAKVKSKDITIDEMWLLNEGHCFRSHTLNLCGAKEEYLAELNFQYKTGSLESLIKIIDKQYGYTLLPKLATLDLSENQKINIREFAKPVPARQISIVTHSSYPRKKIVKALSDAIHHSIPEELLEPDFKTVVKWK